MQKPKKEQNVQVSETKKLYGNTKARNIIATGL
jgi:hypothetical protein